MTRAFGSSEVWSGGCKRARRWRDKLGERRSRLASLFSNEYSEILGAWTVEERRQRRRACCVLAAVPAQGAGWKTRTARRGSFLDTFAFLYSPFEIPWLDSPSALPFLFGHLKDFQEGGDAVKSLEDAAAAARNGQNRVWQRRD